MILAGFNRAERLASACGKLSSRVKNGMSALVINPPSGWSAWGIEASELARPHHSGVKLASGFGREVHPEDLGTGPWRSFLRGGSTAKLVWFEGLAEKRGGNLAAPQRVSCAMVSAARSGRGLVVAAVLPQLVAPDSDAIGRCILNEIILWILANTQEDMKETSQ